MLQTLFIRHFVPKVLANLSKDIFGIPNVITNRVMNHIQKLKIKICRYFSISEHSQCSDQGYTARVSSKTEIEMPALLSTKSGCFYITAFEQIDQISSKFLA